MPATMGATVSSPKAGRVHRTRGNRSSTGRRRARVSAARRRRDRAAVPTRSRTGPSAVPWRRWSATARTSGRAGSPHVCSSESRESARPAPARTARCIESRAWRRDGGAQRTSTGRAAGTVSPAPVVSDRRSMRSGRSASTARRSSAARCARRRRHRTARVMVPAPDRARTGPTSPTATTRATTQPTRRSATGSARSPTRARHHRPTAAGTVPQDRAGRERAGPTRRARGGAATSPARESARTVARPAAMAPATAIIERSSPAGPSTWHRRHRAGARRRCRPTPPGSRTGSAPTWDRGW